MASIVVVNLFQVEISIASSYVSAAVLVFWIRHRVATWQLNGNVSEKLLFSVLRLKVEEMRAREGLVPTVSR